MTSGCLSLGRAMLFPSGLGKSIKPSIDEQDDPIKILDGPNLVQDDSKVYEAIAERVTPFVCCLCEATINVGGVIWSEKTSRDDFRRVMSLGKRQLSGFGWQASYENYRRINRIHLGAERVICVEDQEDCLRRVHNRLNLLKLEANPPLKYASDSNVSLGASRGGSSLFECVSLGLWGSKSYHGRLRKELVDYMYENMQEYAHFLGDDYASYLESMRHDEISGDELVIRALADKFGTPISILTGDEVIWCLRYPPRRLQTRREVVLVATPNATFSLVQRKHANPSSFIKSLVYLGSRSHPEA